MKKILKNKKMFLLIFLILVTLIIILFVLSNYKKEKNLEEPKNEDIYKIEDLSKNDLFYEYYDEAEKIMKNMTLEDKISQLFLLKFKNDLNIDDISYIGGFIFFSQDFKSETKESFINKVLKLQSESKINFALAVDEEGGSVTRISNHKNFRSENFASPRILYQNGGLALVLDTEQEKINLLSSLGININLAPVADISINESDYMYKRSIGLSTDETANYISEVTNLYYKNNFSSCLKHFPGYGKNVDTHKGIAIDNRTIDELKDKDLIPFKSGVDAKTPFVLISHNIMNTIDENIPSTLSKKVIDILKNDLKFTGIIITDDLSMSALDDYRGNSNVATLAVLAGNDMIISNDYNKHFYEILNAVKENIIKEERIEYSVKKIIAWKIAYNII